MLIILALVTALLVLLERGSPVGGHVPVELIGTWVATDGQYAGRRLIIRADSLGFGQGEGRYRFYGIRRVVSEPETPPASRYVVIYRTEVGDAQLRLEHDATTGTVRLEGRRGTAWRRGDG